MTLHEHSVYMWTRWPWCMNSPTGPESKAKQTLLAARWMVRFLFQFRTFVRIESVLEGKRAALAAHRSQMIARASNWRTLHDWSDGEFLYWAENGYEFFRRRQLSSEPDSPRARQREKLAQPPQAFASRAPRQAGVPSVLGNIG